MERLAFNFYRSYYEIALELPEDDRLVFLMAIFEMQFNGNEPTDLKGMAKFAFKSQRHSLIKQLEGYKSGKNGGRPPKGTQKGNHKGNETIPPKGTPNQEKGEEKEKEKVKEQVKEKEKVFTPPPLEDVIKFFEENGYTNGDKAWNYYNDGEWKDSKGNQVINWKQKMRMVWFKEENKRKILRSIHDQDKRTREILGL